MQDAIIHIRAGSNGKGESVVPRDEGVIEFNKMMHLFELCGEQAPEFFVRNHPQLSLSWNEGAALYFLRITYLDSMQTIRSYTRVLCKFSEYLVSCGVSRFNCASPELISNYRLTLQRRNLKARSINTYLAVLKSFYGFMYDMEVVDRNPAKVLKRRISSDAKVIRKKVKGELTGHMVKVLTEQQIEDLLNQVRKKTNSRNALLIEFLYKTGARASEVVKLTWGDLYSLGSLREWYVFLEGKGARSREVYVPYPVVKRLMDFRQQLYGVPTFVDAAGLENVPIFSKLYDKYRPIQYDSIYSIIRKWGESANLKLGLGQKNISPHWLRHTFATHARARGVGIAQIQYVLGHEREATTAIYAKNDHRKNPVGKMFEPFS